MDPNHTNNTSSSLKRPPFGDMTNGAKIPRVEPPSGPYFIIPAGIDYSMGADDVFDENKENIAPGTIVAIPATTQAADEGSGAPQNLTARMLHQQALDDTADQVRQLLDRRRQANHYLAKLLITYFKCEPSFQLFRDGKPFVSLVCAGSRLTKEICYSQILHSFQREVPGLPNSYKNRPSTSFIKAINHIKSNHRNDPGIEASLDSILACPISHKCEAKINMSDDYLPVMVSWMNFPKLTHS